MRENAFNLYTSVIENCFCLNRNKTIEFMIVGEIWLKILPAFWRLIMEILSFLLIKNYCDASFHFCAEP